MHQNRHTTHKVGMEILNLKVIDKNRLVKNLNLEAEYSRGSFVKVVNLVADNKVACGNPTLADHIERMVGSCVDIALVGVKVQNLINRMDVNLCDCLKLGFSGFNIKCPYLVADLDFVNAPMSVLLYHNSITNVNKKPNKKVPCRNIWQGKMK